MKLVVNEPVGKLVATVHVAPAYPFATLVVVRARVVQARSPGELGEVGGWCSGPFRDYSGTA